MTSVRVRFAPSPTGFLHIGGMRTALFNYLFAKKHQGKFILRLEDTDRERFVPEGVEQIVQSLDWLGFKPDEGFWIENGKHQNIEYVQSERQKTGLYGEYVDKLVGAGLAYESYISASEYEKAKAGHIKSGLAFVYRRSMEGQYHNGSAPKKSGHYPVRLDIEAARQKTTQQVDWNDEIRGSFNEALADIEDFVLIKSDGFPTYNFANVIDDYEMKISHVIRGDEFLSSTAKHALLFDLLGFQRPAWVHLPAINGSDGKKLSKRTGDTNVLDYRTKGYLSAALTNFLSLLGWNDGTEQEIFSIDELVDKFSLERIQKSPAVFDLKRLNWMNGVYVRKHSLKDLYKLSTSYWPPEAKNADAGHKRRVLETLQDRLKVLSELSELADFFFARPELTKTELAKLKTEFSEPKSLKIWLEEVKNWLDKVDTSDRGKLEAGLRKLIAQKNSKPAPFFIVLRVILTAHDQTPPIWDIIYGLGKSESKARLERAVELL